ncbi:MAG: hypothetical protein R3C14_10210 [Caldilineaceae bacterium]
MRFRRLSEISEIIIIARGKSVEIHAFLNRTFGRGDWRKLKGIAIVEYTNGQIGEVELHWFEAHGIGRRLEKDKKKLRRIA